jgi:hypothetical protein
MSNENPLSIEDARRIVDANRSALNAAGQLCGVPFARVDGAPGHSICPECGVAFPDYPAHYITDHYDPAAALVAAIDLEECEGASAPGADDKRIDALHFCYRSGRLDAINVENRYDTNEDIQQRAEAVVARATIICGDDPEGE